MALNLDEIWLIAIEVRQWVEKKAGSNFSLCGWCAIASAELCYQLKQRGYKPKICFTYGHSFVRLGAYLIDITATQFRQAPKEHIVLLRYKEIKPYIEGKYWFWDCMASFSCMKQAREYQQQMDWCEEQLILEKEK